MERLTEKVYECNLAVEAHMVVDLLSQAGISARVEGEFMQGIAGEIPLGNTVKVRVDPARAAEAREVIADWEKLQPPPDSAVAPTVKSPRLATPLLLLLGALGGGALTALLMSLRTASNGVDYNDDGHDDVIFHYAGDRPTSTEYDRNLDRRIDARWTFDWYGNEKSFESDDDFDGRFEWQAEVENGNIRRSVLDADGDGRPEQVWHFVNGVVASADFHFASGGRIVKRQFYRNGLLDSADFDDDGDGRFERRVQYDAHAEPKL